MTKLRTLQYKLGSLARNKGVLLVASNLLAFAVIHNMSYGTYHMQEELNTSKTTSAKHNSPSDGRRKLPKSSTSGTDIRQYSQVLQRYACKDGWIILALADQGCYDMAINFYKTSLEPFQITNYLFLGGDEKTCVDMQTEGIHCYMYKVDRSAGKASLYNSKDFLRKMNIRTYAILDALNLGYNVLHSDVDVTFMQNPWLNFDYKSTSYDIAPLVDWKVMNAGFVFVRNSTGGKAVYKFSKHIADTEPKTDDQKALNRAINKAKKTNSLKVTSLPKNVFLCGKAFWNTKNRNFAGDEKSCKDCAVVHNNWIISMEAKTLRFKELHWWVVDRDQYYSSTERKYISYSNPVNFNRVNQVDALKDAFAIAEILNRSVILPKFQCGNKFNKKCLIINYLKLRDLEKVFPNYRESTFLTHEKVPERVKTSGMKKMYFIDSSPIKNKPDHVITLNPKNSTEGANDQEILDWFQTNTDSVLHFHSLYKAFSGFVDKSEDDQFNKKLQKAFVPGAYKQM